MELNWVTTEDYESIIAFYDDVTKRTPDMERYARWQKGKHPTEEGIRAYVEEGSMYLYKENDVIIGAMAVTMCQGDDYHAIRWSQQVQDNEVAVIHILAVSPNAQGKGIGSEMIRKAIRLARTNGMKAIRLDALASNTPAHKIYKALGFEYRGQQHLYAENTGWTDFYFFEYKEVTIIRFIEKEKWDEALKLVKEVFMEFEAPDYSEEGIADFMHAIGDESYLNMHRFYGAYQNDKLVGVIATRNDHHHIGLLFVDKNYQRKGIGRQLIQYVLDMKDEEPITVNASPYGHEFYKKLGFADASEEQITNGVRYYPMKRYTTELPVQALAKGTAKHHYMEMD